MVGKVARYPLRAKFLLVACCSQEVSRTSDFLLFVRVCLTGEGPRSHVWPGPGGWHSIGAKTLAVSRFIVQNGPSGS
jgi:hypothetical protein